MDRNTPDMFRQDRMQIVVNPLSPEEEKSTLKIYDTQEITDIYLQRPGSIATMPLGVWFNAAHLLRDNDLRNCAVGSEVKRLIVRKGYNSLPLGPLEAFNQAWTNKPQKS